MKQRTIHCIDVDTCTSHVIGNTVAITKISSVYSLTKIIASIGATKPKIVPSSMESQQLLTQNTVNN